LHHPFTVSRLCDERTPSCIAVNKLLITMMPVAHVGSLALDSRTMPRAAPYRASITIIALLSIHAMTVAARAQDNSPWKKELHAAARLIAGAALKSFDTVWFRAGVEIRLDPGWHTYWRYPGDTGIPPTFDFGGSENVKSVTVLWPAPKRFADGTGGHFIGYTDDVVFPLRIAAQDATRPSSLHLKLGYAFCREVCFPAEADLDLALSSNSGATEPLLVAAEARVPRRVPLGVAARLAIRSVHRERGDQRVVVEVAAPEGTPVDLFVEGPESTWALPLPDLTDPAPGSVPGVRQFDFDLDGLPPGAQVDGAILTFTAVSPDDAIEVGATLKQVQ
jgi:DsbC/DsbD-like thiol-disulfide interchange protein